MKAISIKTLHLMHKNLIEKRTSYIFLENISEDSINKIT